MGAHSRRLRLRSQFRLPRFFARYVEALSEAKNAFVVNDRDHSVHPICGGTHHETLFAIPPAAPLNHCVAKAYAEGTSAVVVIRSRSPLLTGPRLTVPPSSSTRTVALGPTPAGGLPTLGYCMDAANFAVDASRGQRGAVLLPTFPGVTRDGSGAEILAGPPPHH